MHLLLVLRIFVYTKTANKMKANLQELKYWAVTAAILTIVTIVAIYAANNF